MLLPCNQKLSFKNIEYDFLFITLTVDRSFPNAYIEQPTFVVFIRFSVSVSVNFYDFDGPRNGHRLPGQCT